MAYRLHYLRDGAGFMSFKKIAIIGAGPKAMAIASKTKVLAELGFAVPEIHIIEKRAVGANWSGDFGYTNGKLELGTSPEKDIGFPYNSTCWDAATNQKVDARMRDFSWQSFLIDQTKFSDWVDRGRPAPAHKEWADYLQWVWKLNKPRTTCHRGEVTRLRLTHDRWIVDYSDWERGNGTLECDGLVVTGPGKIRLDSALPVHDNILNVESFWKAYGRFAEPNREPVSVALVGNGENAASIAMALATLGKDRVNVDILSPQGMAFSRGESFRENRVYSNADNGHWETLNEVDRRNFIHRTDRGVFSISAQKALDRADNVDVIPGRLQSVAAVSADGLEVTFEYSGIAKKKNYRYVIVATGSDQLSFLRSIMDESTEREVRRRANLEAFVPLSVEARIDHGLELRGLNPRLHLPMLSGIAQGPGFANLSCLGRLSDRILKSYVA